MDPITDTKDLVDTTSKAIQKLGPITFAFFLLLFAVLAFVYYNFKGHDAVVHAMDAKIDVLTTKLDTALKNQSVDREVLIYYLRQYCLQGAETPEQKNGCDLPSRLTNYPTSI